MSDDANVHVHDAAHTTIAGDRLAFVGNDPVAAVREPLVVSEP